MAVKEDVKKYLTEEEKVMLYRVIEDYAEKHNLSIGEKVELIMKHRPISKHFANSFRIFDGEEAFNEIEKSNIELIKRQEWIYGIKN